MNLYRRHRWFAAAAGVTLAVAGVSVVAHRSAGLVGFGDLAGLVLMLLGWWIFLYAFIVFPHQYVAKDVGLYNLCYRRLYLVENILLLAALGQAAWTSSSGWRRLYLHFFAAALLY